MDLRKLRNEMKIKTAIDIMEDEKSKLSKSSDFGRKFRIDIEEVVAVLQSVLKNDTVPIQDNNDSVIMVDCILWLNCEESDFELFFDGNYF